MSVGQYAPESISAEELILRPKWSILSKGVTGSGKTIFSTGKEFRPVYVFDFEGRFDSVLRYYKRLDNSVKDIFTNHFPIDDSSSFFKADQKMDAIAARPEYKTIVISSLTSFIRLVLVHLQRSSIKKEEGGKTRGVKMKGGIQVNILEDYNYEDSAIINSLIGFLQVMFSQGVNVILEAHITPYEIKSIDEQSGEKDLTTVMEILTKGKKAPAEVPAWFNEVWLFEKRVLGNWDQQTIKYVVNTEGNNVNACKSSAFIKPFDWTNKDGSVLLHAQLSDEVKATPRVDPNASKRVSW